MIDIDQCPYGFESYEKSPWAETVPDEVARPTMELRFNTIRSDDTYKVVGNRLEQKWAIIRRGNPAGYEWRPVPVYDAYALSKKH
jgi:hypothetical protein